MQKARKSSSMMAMMHHKGGQEIVREDDYKGHHVVVRTKYTITVDGQEVTGHIMLTNTGQVQYHGLPNHSFDSTLGLVRRSEERRVGKSVDLGGRRIIKKKTEEEVPAVGLDPRHAGGDAGDDN